MSTLWESDQWEAFALDHEFWRLMIPSLQPALRRQYFEGLLPVLNHLCTQGGADADAEYLDNKVAALLSNGPPEQQTAVFLLSLALFPTVADHGLLVEGGALHEWMDRDIPACIAMWVGANNGGQVALFVAQCIIAYRQAIARNVLRAKRRQLPTLALN